MLVHCVRDGVHFTYLGLGLLGVWRVIIRATLQGLVSNSMAMSPSYRPNKHNSVKIFVTKVTSLSTRHWGIGALGQHSLENFEITSLLDAGNLISFW